MYKRQTQDAAQRRPIIEARLALGQDWQLMLAILAAASIGLGNVDEPLMSRMAQETGGSYSYAPDPTGQARTSNSIAGQDAGGQPPHGDDAGGARGGGQKPGASGASGDSHPPLVEERAKIPRQIGRFQVVRRLGSGGFGVVFLAEDPVLRRQVAIKMPLASIFQSLELHARFLRECRAAAKLDHPGIVPIYEVGEYEGQQYFSMKLIEPGEPGRVGPGAQGAQVRQVPPAPLMFGREGAV